MVETRSTYIRRRVIALTTVLVLTSAGVAGASGGSEGVSVAPTQQTPAHSSLEGSEVAAEATPASCNATAQQISCSATFR